MNRNNKTHKLTPVEEAIRYFDPYPHPVLRMMAEDYESRQRKKNKFGGGTSNRKDPYEEQEDINGYNYVGKGDMRGLYQVPNSSEYKGYWTADGHPIGIDWETGNLVDQITGETGILNLPEITVTGTEKPHTYATSMSANLPLGPTLFNPKGVQEPTLGQKAKAVEDVSRGMRVLSPAAWMDTAYDAMYTPDEINFPWMEGNQGLGDPFLDILFDAGVYGGLSKLNTVLKIGNKVPKDIKTPNAAYYIIEDDNTPGMKTIIDQGISYEIPDYATINAPRENALKFHLQRISQGPYKGIKIKEIPTDPLTDDQLIDLYVIMSLDNARNQGINVSFDLMKQLALQRFTRQGLLEMLRKPGTGFGTNHIVLYSDDLIKQGNYNKAILMSHERHHALNPTVDSYEGAFDIKGHSYFADGHELAARGTQIKNYFGLTSPDQKITPDMLRYARDHYIMDTGQDNNMTEFFNYIIDYDKAAEWLSKYSTAVATPIGMGIIYKNSNNNEKNHIK